MIKVYVAASSREKHRFEFVKELLAASETLELAHDWVEVQASVQADGGPTDAELTRADARRYAIQDLSHVECADAFWLLAPETRTSGAWVEFGYAIAALHAGRSHFQPGKRALIVVSGAFEGSIFCACADEEHTTDHGAFESITAWGRGNKEATSAREKAPLPSSSKQ